MARARRESTDSANLGHLPRIKALNSRASGAEEGSVWGPGNLCESVGLSRDLWERFNNREPLNFSSSLPGSYRLFLGGHSTRDTVTAPERAAYEKQVTRHRPLSP
ncbi:hypothetical protein WMY93_009566 [Mugilogobius chulae]|uniref:Uncharacterized protein n=1 Tax=Mugilogobius chulae TaxID=88201 RepID=A0AAW0PQI9_9GOBI